MKTARDVTYQLVRESGLTTILGEAGGAPVWAAPACECAPFPEDHPL